MIVAQPWQGRLLFVLLLVTLTCPNLACAQRDKDVAQSVHSTLEGRISVKAEVDSSADYRGFEVLIAVDNEGEPDTLGYAITDSTGYFSTDIEAPERGVYALIISRRGYILKIGHLAVAEGDSAMLTVAFPIGARSMRPRSVENASWQSYQNTRLQHEQDLVELARSENYDEQAIGLRVAQTAIILWGLQEIYPGTMGAEVGAAEAVIMSAGWNDSLVVAWANTIASDHVQFSEIGRAARQATARLRGQSAALEVLDDFTQRATRDEDRAQLISERVLAHLDSLEYDAALAAAKLLQSEHADSPWAEWAERASYEIENLLPGMLAPAFTAQDTSGVEVTLADLRGKYVVLEFYRPEDDVYQREVEGRNRLIADVGHERLEILSISLQPDTVINQAFFEEREMPGIHVYGTVDLAEVYNINVVPTRYLIDPEGRMVSKYVGGAMAALYEYMIRLDHDE